MMSSKSVPVLFLVLALALPGVVNAQESGDNKPAAKSSVERLLKDLGAEDYDTREAATLALIKRGPRITQKVKALHEKTRDPEVKARTRFILDKLGAVPRENSKPRDRSLDRPKRPQGPRLRPLVPGPGGGIPDLQDMFKDMPPGFDKLFEGMQKELGQALQDMLKDMFNPQDPQNNKPRGKQPQFKGFFGVPGQPLRPINPRRSKARPFRHPTGLRARPPAPELRAHIGLPLRDGGLIITDIEKGSWGEKAGLKKHDIIAKIDGESVVSLDEFDVCEQREVMAEIIRAGKRQKINLPKRATRTTKRRRDF